MRTMRIFGLILITLGVPACAFDDHRTCSDDTHCENEQRCQFSYCVDPVLQPAIDAHVDMRAPQQDMAVPDMAVPDMGSPISRHFEATDDAYVTVNGDRQVVHGDSESLRVRQSPLRVTYIRFDLGGELNQRVRARLRLHIEAPSSAEKGVVVQQTQLNWVEGQNAPLMWDGARLGSVHWLSLGPREDVVEFDLEEIQLDGQHVAFWIIPTPGFGGELEIHSTNAVNAIPPQLLITKIP